MAYAIGHKVFVAYQQLLNTIICLFFNKRSWKYMIKKNYKTSI